MGIGVVIQEVRMGFCRGGKGAVLGFDGFVVLCGWKGTGWEGDVELGHARNEWDVREGNC